jgi:uncharacterized protein YegP (UPF0339 family)
MKFDIKKYAGKYHFNIVDDKIIAKSITFETKNECEMCIKKIMQWLTPVDPAPIPNPAMKKIALLFAINNYPGSQNDLNGCLNDQTNVSGKLPDFDKRIFKDSQVTVANFKAEVLKAANETVTGDVVVIHYSGHGTYLADYNGDEIDGKDEALYLYDGPLVDDDFGDLLDNFKPGVKVIIFLDSCFSESATRVLNLMPNKDKGKFKIYKGFKGYDNVPHNKLVKPITWVVFSGCSEHQTSADAYINGHYEGAFTHFLMDCIDRKLTYKQWYAELRKSLPSSEYDQIPTLEGPDEITNQLIFT